MRILTLILILLLLREPVFAMEFTPPEAPEDISQLISSEPASFGEDLWTIVTDAISALEPEIAQCSRVCLSFVILALLLSLLKTVPGCTVNTVELAGVLGAAALLLQPTGSMISLASQTVTQLSDYGKLLIPVMTSALAAQGGITASTALYAGTMIFDAIFSALISSILVPMVYILLILSVAAAATGEKLLSELSGFVQWLMIWCLKTILYVFTGYIAITGVVSGTTDAAALRVTKLTMSGAIPVVGGILSEASEAVIVGAGVMKNAAGIYGVLALIGICITPFLRIGVLYLLLKLTAAVCAIFDVKPVCDIIRSFSGAMGLLLGMTGAVCIMLLISLVCFMKGVS